MRKLVFAIPLMLGASISLAQPPRGEREPGPPADGPGPSAEALVDRLMQFDADDDGLLSREELLQAPLRPMLSRLGVSGEGRFGRREFEARGDRGPRPPRGPGDRPEFGRPPMDQAGPPRGDRRGGAPERGHRPDGPPPERRDGFRGPSDDQGPPPRGERDFRGREGDFPPPPPPHDRMGAPGEPGRGPGDRPGRPPRSGPPEAHFGPAPPQPPHDGMAPRGDRRPEHGPPPAGQIVPEPLMDRLQLSDSQREQLTQLQEEVDSRLAEILDDEQQAALKHPGPPREFHPREDARPRGGGRPDRRRPDGLPTPEERDRPSPDSGN